jgi:hypothetical protein
MIYIRYLRFLSLFFSLSIAFESEAQSSTSDKLDPAARSQIVDGLERNDARIFVEVSKLPIEQGAPYLLVYVDDATTNKERAERARETLKSMQGFTEYMKHRIIEKRTKLNGEYTMDEFRMLGLIGGDRAAAATAPFLFVEDIPALLGDDYGTSPIYFQAMYALTEMHLSDAPVAIAGWGDKETWKTWAIKKGYRDSNIPSLVPLEAKGASPELVARSKAALADAIESDRKWQATIKADPDRKERRSAGEINATPTQIQPTDKGILFDKPETEFPKSKGSVLTIDTKRQFVRESGGAETSANRIRGGDLLCDE